VSASYNSHLIEFTWTRPQCRAFAWYSCHRESHKICHLPPLFIKFSGTEDHSSCIWRCGDAMATVRLLSFSTILKFWSRSEANAQVLFNATMQEANITKPKLAPTQVTRFSGLRCLWWHHSNTTPPNAPRLSWKVFRSLPPSSLTPAFSFHACKIPEIQTVTACSDAYLPYHDKFTVGCRLFKKKDRHIQKKHLKRVKVQCTEL
jgi:hypothetical protein